MRTALHLVSLPMHDPLQPSAQLGYLHGHAARMLSEICDTHSYSGHFDILWLWKEWGMREAYFDHRLFGEELFFLAAAHNHPRLFDRAFAAYEGFVAPPIKATRAEIADLAACVKSWVRLTLAPSLVPDRLNVIGFSTTFAQVFASILVCRELLELAPAPMLFLFGGASVTIPETRRALSLWGIDGLVVQSNGEAPLQALILALDALSEVANPLESVTAKAITNISRIGADQAPIDLGISRAAMAAIGDPDYDEFFGRIARFCPENTMRARLLESIALPVEGSRGCFAKCDFCQNPLITSTFRTLDGEAVAVRVQRLADRYGAGRIYFADSVCNSWADDYARRMIADAFSLPAFMELRVHAPERFFTRLALAGVNEVQLGIEALSTPLLNTMRKGTKVWQNVCAVKYLAELGIRSVSNIITHHPHSTAADVAETRRVTAALSHLTRLSLSQFVVSYGSPFWAELTEDQRAALSRGFVWLPESLRPYSTQRDLAYPYPSTWLEPAMKAAWDSFRRDWQVAHASPVTLRLTAHDRVEDSRGGKLRTHQLGAGAARLLDAAHHAPRRADLAQSAGLTESAACAALEELRGGALLLDLDDRVLALPLRPRAWLLARAAEPTPAADARTR